MDQIKLENFRKEHGFDMPIIKSLPYDECLKIRENLIHKFSLDDVDEFFKIDKFSRLDGFNADEENLISRLFLESLTSPRQMKFA